MNAKTRKIIVAGIIVLALTTFAVNVIAASQVSALLGNTNAGEAMWWLKRGLYAEVSLIISKQGIEFLIQNFDKLILMNPDPKSVEMQNIIAPLMQVIMPMYIFAIATTGFYLLFVSGSPSGRASAKKMFVQLIIGMIAVSQSTVILQLMINLSTSVTSAIINEGSVRVNIIPESIKAIFGSSSLTPSTSSLALIHIFLTYVEIELGYFTMLPFILVIWGSLVVFFLRYAILVLWTILFPLAIALYSFETTKALGRNILEQTIVWILMQEFFAAIAIATALSIMQKPAWYMTPSVYLFNAPVEFVVFDFIPFMGCFALLIAPLLMLRIFRSFLP